MSLNSSRTRSRTASHSSYRFKLLTGQVELVRYEEYENSSTPQLQRCYPVCRDLEDKLLMGVDDGFLSQLDAEQKATLHKRRLRLQKDGYGNFELILHANDVFSSTCEEMRGYNAYQWSSFFYWHVCNHLQLCKLFSFTTWGERWRKFDPALTQIQPSRAALSKPSPKFAFGIHTDGKYGILDDWQYNSSPSTDLLVHNRLAVPFFIYQVEEESGSLVTGENQLVTAMRMAHDILRTLDLQDSLHIFGMVQVGAMVHLYISFGIDDVVGKRRIHKRADKTHVGKRYCDEIYVFKLQHLVLNLATLNGLLTYWRFVEHVKLYGLETFTPAVLHAIEVGSPPQVPDCEVPVSSNESPGVPLSTSILLHSG